MYDFSLCSHCRCAVDLKDTFEDRCPLCGEPAVWDDSATAAEQLLADNRAAAALLCEVCGEDRCTHHN